LSSGSEESKRVCVIGAGPCGLTAVKNLLSAGLDDVVCYEESGAIGGTWVFDARPERTTVYESTHIISSKALSAFEDFPMPEDYPDFPSHQQMRAYFELYAKAFGILNHISLRTRVEAARLLPNGRWSIRIMQPDGSATEETFDALLVCSGHLREPAIPTYPGTFSGEILHSQGYKRAEPFRDKRVLVVGGGNTACDVAVEIARVAARTVISMRRGYYISPKIMFGRPVDVLYARLRRLNWLPKSAIRSLMTILLRLGIGPWEKYGLAAPQGRLFEMHPTLNTNILAALRDGMVVPREGIATLDGPMVRFRNGRAEAFDAIVWATGFHVVFPFFDRSIVDWNLDRTPPLYLRMMHPRIGNLFFIGLFQPIGCIWRLADFQARIAALQIAGRLLRPADIGTRIARQHPHWHFDAEPRHALEVDYHDFRNELMRELARVI
jgi:cation diffusion facilitator CzcD-associated flavoprotein CzcO